MPPPVPIASPRQPLTVEAFRAQIRAEVAADRPGAWLLYQAQRAAVVAATTNDLLEVYAAAVRDGIADQEK